MASSSAFNPQKSAVRIWIALLCCALMATFVSCGRDATTEREVDRTEVATSNDGWKSPETCRECHEAVFHDWQRSHHAIANREVDAEIDGEAFEAGEVTDEAGVSYEVGRNDEGDFVIRQLGVDAPEMPVAGVIGEAPLRQFLMKGERGRLQAHSLAWDPEAKEWFSVFGDEERQPGEWGHWTGQGMNWNANCASCHMTEYAKKYDVESDSYASSWTRQGISCIECHSGMDTHVIEARVDGYVADRSAMVARDMDNCARCHSRREELTANRFRPGDRYDDHYRLMLPDHPTAYFAGGQANEENYVTGSLMFSHMGLKGVSCMDCHNPHSGEPILPWENNALCIRCHETGNKGATLIDSASHSGHQPGTAASQCVTCHMPERTYMGRDARRDHGFTSPDPYLTERYGSPNACATCHDEEGREWIQAGWERLFDETDRIQNTRRRADLVERVRKGEVTELQPYLDELEREENPYWRAAWLRLLSDFGEDQEVAAVAAAALAEGEPIERDAAVRVLSVRQDGPERIAKALRDESRLPRVGAASYLTDYYHEDELAFREWREWADFNSDWPSVALTRADMALRENDRDLARSLVDRAIGFDPHAPALRYDAAILLDRMGLSEEAIKQMTIAREQEPREGRFAYAMGLLHGGKEDYVAAAASFAEAVGLDPNQDRWWYNLAIAQARVGEVDKAIESLERALSIAPSESAYREFRDSLLMRAR